MCLRDGPVEDAKGAYQFYVGAHLEEYMAENPDITKEESARKLLFRFEARLMTDKERAPWDRTRASR